MLCDMTKAKKNGGRSSVRLMTDLRDRLRVVAAIQRRDLQDALDDAVREYVDRTEKKRSA